MCSMKVISPDPEGKTRPVQQGTGDVAFISSCLPKVPVAYNQSWKWQTGCNLTIHYREAGSVGQELCFSVSQKTKWLQRKKSVELGIGTLPQSIPLHRLSGVHPVTLFQDPDGKKPRTYHSCILAFSPVSTSSSTLPLVTPSGFLLGLRFDIESDLLMWVAAIKDAVSSPIGSSHLPSVFHVTVPRHQVIEAQDALLMLEPVTPYPTSAVLRHAITLDAIHTIELWKVVSVGHRLDVSQLWVETPPSTVKSRDNAMITVLCNDVVKASESLRQAIAPHLLYDEVMREDVSNQMVMYRKCRTRPGSQLRSSSPVSTEYATITLASADRRESSASTSSSIFSWKSLPNLQKERVNHVYGSVGDVVGGSTEYLATSPPTAAPRRNSQQLQKPFATVPSSVQQGDVSQLCIDDQPYDLTAVNPDSKYRSKGTQQSTRSLPPSMKSSTAVRSSSLHDLRSIGVRRNEENSLPAPRPIDVHDLELTRLNSRARLLPGQVDTHSVSSDDVGAATSGSLVDDPPEYKNIPSEKVHGSIRVGQKRSVPGPDGYTEIAPDESVAVPATARERVRKMEERRRQASSLKHATKSESSLSHSSTLPRSIGRLAPADEHAARRQLAVPGEQEGRSNVPSTLSVKRPSALARHSIASPLSHAVSLDRLPLARPSAESHLSRSTSNLSSGRSVSPGSDDAFNAAHFYHDIAPKDGVSATTARPLPVPEEHSAATRSKSVPSAASVVIHPLPPAEESKALQRAKKISSRRKAAAAAAGQPASNQAPAAPLAAPHRNVYSYDALQSDSTDLPSPAAVSAQAAAAAAAAGVTHDSATHVLNRRADTVASMKVRRADPVAGDYTRLELKTTPPVAAPRARNAASARMDSSTSQGSLYSVPPPPVRADNYEVVAENTARTQPNTTYDVPPQTYNVPPQPVLADNSEVDSNEQPNTTYDVPRQTYDVPPQTYDVLPQPVRADNDEVVDSNEHPALTQPNTTYDVPPQTYGVPPQTYDVPPQTYDVPPQTYDVPPQPVRADNYEVVDESKALVREPPASVRPPVPVVRTYDVPPRPVRAAAYKDVDTNSTARSAASQSVDAVVPQRPPKPSYRYSAARPVQADGRGAQAQQVSTAVPVPAGVADSAPPTGQELSDVPAQLPSAGELENEYMSMQNSDISHLKQSVPVAGSTVAISAQSVHRMDDLYTAMDDLVNSLDDSSASAPASGRDAGASPAAGASVAPPLDGRPTTITTATSGTPTTAMPRYGGENPTQAPTAVQQRYSQDDQYVDIRGPAAAGATVDRSKASTRYSVPVSQNLSAQNVYSTVDAFERTPASEASTSSDSQSRMPSLGRTVTVDELYTDMTDTLRRKQRVRTNADESSPVLTTP